MQKILVSVVLMVFLCAGAAFAEAPLITDEAEALDKGEFEIELNAEHSIDKEYFEGVKIEERETELEMNFIYGVVDNLELEIEVPYAWVKEKEDGVESFKANGLGDVGLELKWRFYDEDDLSLALKPTVTFPTGDEEKELGTGKMSYGLMFLTTKEFDPIELEIHFNVGVTHYDYKIAEEEAEARSDIWHVSAAVVKGITKNLKAAVDIGMETNPDKTSSTEPAYILGGFMYSLSKQLQAGLGAKFGLTETEPDLAIIAGVKYALF